MQWTRRRETNRAARIRRDRRLRAHYFYLLRQRHRAELQRLNARAKFFARETSLNGRRTLFFRVIEQACKRGRPQFAGEISAPHQSLLRLIAKSIAFKKGALDALRIKTRRRTIEQHKNCDAIFRHRIEHAITHRHTIVEVSANNTHAFGCVRWNRCIGESREINIGCVANINHNDDATQRVARGLTDRLGAFILEALARMHFDNDAFLAINPRRHRIHQQHASRSGRTIRACRSCAKFLIDLNDLLTRSAHRGLNTDVTAARWKHKRFQQRIRTRQFGRHRQRRTHRMEQMHDAPHKHRRPRCIIRSKKHGLCVGGDGKFAA